MRATGVKSAWQITVRDKKSDVWKVFQVKCTRTSLCILPEKEDKCTVKDRIFKFIQRRKSWAIKQKYHRIKKKTREVSKAQKPHICGLWNSIARGGLRKSKKHMKSKSFDWSKQMNGAWRNIMQFFIRYTSDTEQLLETWKKYLEKQLNLSDYKHTI